MYLKKAARTPQSETESARQVVAAMLAEIEKRGEAAVREYAEKLDGWKGEILVAPSACRHFFACRLKFGRSTKQFNQLGETGNRTADRAAFLPFSSPSLSST